MLMMQRRRHFHSFVIFGKHFQQSVAIVMPSTVANHLGRKPRKLENLVAAVESAGLGRGVNLALPFPLF